MLYLVTVIEKGELYEVNGTDVVGIFTSLDKAKEVIYHWFTEYNANLEEVDEDMNYSNTNYYGVTENGENVTLQITEVEADYEYI